MTTIEVQFWPTGEHFALTLGDDQRIVGLLPLAPAPNRPWFIRPVIDNHCHVLPAGLDLAKLHLGGCESRGAVCDRVRDRLAQTPEGDWLLAVHYDQARFSDNVHLTRDALDAISTRVPILLRHVNGHASVANSAALERAGIAEDIADPSGGEYVRDSSGRLNGVLLEEAHDYVTAKVPRPDRAAMVAAIRAAGESMAGYGIECAADMMTGRFDLTDELHAYRQVANDGPIRFRLYVQWREVFGPRGMGIDRFRDLMTATGSAESRVAGIKIFADGAIGSRTAAIYGQYDGSDGAVDEGQLIYAPTRLQDMVRTAADAGFPVAVHAIGDRAVDLTLDAFEQTSDPRVHRLEHAMLLSDAQIERIARWGGFVTMQPEFLTRFGHSYLKQLGSDRASRLKRFRSVADAGIPLSFSSDRPIVAGDPYDGMECALRRPEGFDPAENLDFARVWAAYASEAARAMHDEPSDIRVGTKVPPHVGWGLKSQPPRNWPLL